MELATHEIARQFLPRRTHYYYARIKLATDPLYTGVGRVLASSREPLLDLGCGIGLLAHALRAQGFAGSYRGVDIDGGKIDSARAAGERAGLSATHFERVDLAAGFPAHRGSVALLDIVQFLPPPAQDALLDAAIESLTPAALLVMRSGLHRDGWRLRFTRGIDRLARFTRWMNVGPQRYPSREDLQRRFDRHGLSASFQPLSGRMPFENWLICARRAGAEALG
jgi:SAM-dependent methyltransferase